MLIENAAAIQRMQLSGSAIQVSRYQGLASGPGSLSLSLGAREKTWGLVAEMKQSQLTDLIAKLKEEKIRPDAYCLPEKAPTSESDVLEDVGDGFFVYYYERGQMSGLRRHQDGKSAIDDFIDRGLNDRSART